MEIIIGGTLLVKVEIIARLAGDGDLYFRGGKRRRGDGWRGNGKQ